MVQWADDTTLFKLNHAFFVVGDLVFGDAFCFFRQKLGKSGYIGVLSVCLLNDALAQSIAVDSCITPCSSL